MDATTADPPSLGLDGTLCVLRHAAIADALRFASVSVEFSAAVEAHLRTWRRDLPTANRARHAIESLTHLMARPPSAASPMSAPP